MQSASFVVKLIKKEFTCYMYNHVAMVHTVQLKVQAFYVHTCACIQPYSLNNMNAIMLKSVVVHVRVLPRTVCYLSNSL